jgi:hypothetical protein
MGETMTDFRYLDPALFYRGTEESWESIEEIDQNDPLGLKFLQLLKLCVKLPNENQYLAAAVFSLLNAKWCKCAPVGFSFGAPNSGKSTLGNLISLVRGYPDCFSPTDTFSSIRNSLDDKRWIDKENKLEKDGTFLVWDNISRETFKLDNRIFQLLLIGYSRSSSILKIATPDGGVLNFDVFCPKLISSIFPLHCTEGLLELCSRMLIFQHEPLPIEDDFEPLDYKGYCFESLKSEYIQFWNTEELIFKYVDFRKSFAKTKTPLKGRKKELSLDLLSHSMVYGFFTDKKEAIAYWVEFFEVQETWLKASKSDIGSLLEQFLDDFFEIHESNPTNKLARKMGEPIEFSIENSMISSFLAEKKRLGEISQIPKSAQIEEILMSLGLFRIVENKKVFWRKK